MTKEEYIALCERYIAGDCTNKERQLIEEHQQEFGLVDQPWDEGLMGAEAETRDSIYFRLRENMNVQEGKKKFYISTRWLAAASVILIISAGAYFLNNRLNYRQDIVQQTELQGADEIGNTILSQHQRFKNDVSPGKAKAVLILDNGSKIVLDDVQNGVLAKQGNAEVKKQQKGQLIYNITGSDLAVSKYNTVRTPLGGQYQIVLPDGSKVWLNAGSSLRFPTVFVNKERIVELSGEAYFEVAKNKEHPFRVHVNGMDVKVLGTHFNIMAYNDEGKINTTLLEGAVEVSRGSEQKYLKPGQQATLVKTTGSMNIAPVNVEQEVAWKNGYFVFQNESIQSIMRQVSRWYNVEVVFDGDMTGKDFAGTISRNENVSGLLNMLELTGVIHFKIEGRRITVMP